MTAKEGRSVESLAWTKTDSTVARYMVVAHVFNPRGRVSQISVSLRLALSTEAFQDSQGEEEGGGGEISKCKREHATKKCSGKPSSTSVAVS